MTEDELLAKLEKVHNVTVKRHSMFGPIVTFWLAPLTTYSFMRDSEGKWRFENGWGKIPAPMSLADVVKWVKAHPPTTEQTATQAPNGAQSK